MASGRMSGELGEGGDGGSYVGTGGDVCVHNLSDPLAVIITHCVLKGRGFRCARGRAIREFEFFHGFRMEWFHRF